MQLCGATSVRELLVSRTEGSTSPTRTPVQIESAFIPSFIEWIFNCLNFDVDGSYSTQVKTVKF